MKNNLSYEDLCIVALDYLGISRVKILKLVESIKPLTNITNSIYKDLVCKVLSQEQYSVVLQKITNDNLNLLDKDLQTKQVKVLTVLNNNYPKSLCNIIDKPALLYVKGNIDLLNHKYILGIVGTRKPTRYGREIAEDFTTELVNNDVVTISGLAYGIDSVVANSTLLAGGRTIAVLGGGFSNIYPSSNTNLAQQIIENNGLLISEYAPHIKPTNYSFPERNRIIAGISRGVLIIEAGEKSGSLITANFALEQGKELYVVPANLKSPQSIGSNKIIYEMPQAMVIEPSNILCSFGIKSKPKDKDNNLQLTIEQQLVYDLLLEEEQHFDDLVKKTKINASDMNNILTEMEMLGIIKKIAGNYYQL